MLLLFCSGLLAFSDALRVYITTKVDAPVVKLKFTCCS